MSENVRDRVRKNREKEKVDTEQLLQNQIKERI